MKKKLSKGKYLNIFHQVMSLSLVRRHQNVVYALPKEVSTIYRRKNIFLRCEDSRVSGYRKLNVGVCKNHNYCKTKMPEPWKKNTQV